MQKRVVLPQVELNMESVTVLEWLVEVGERVTAGQNLVRVETQKATVDVPSSDDGYLRKQCVKAGDNIADKALLSILTDSPDEPITDVSPEVGSMGGRQAAPEVALAAPAARKLAKNLGIDLATITGTGPNGRITVEDVQGAAKGQALDASALSGWTNLSPSRIALIGQMQKSLQEIPQFHVLREIDVATLSKKDGQVTFTHRLIFATAAALAQHPALRTSIKSTRTRVEPVSVAVAMDTSSGLVAPAIRNTDKLSLQEVSAMCLDLRTRAKVGSIRREELINAPFAISNLGMLGVDLFNPFVFHGQTAVLGVGRAREVDNRKVAWFSLAADHRIVDGAEAARFLETLQLEISKL